MKTDLKPFNISTNLRTYGIGKSCVKLLFIIVLIYKLSIIFSVGQWQLYSAVCTVIPGQGEAGWREGENKRSERDTWG